MEPLTVIPFNIKTRDKTYAKYIFLGVKWHEESFGGIEKRFQPIVLELFAKNVKKQVNLYKSQDAH